MATKRKEDGDLPADGFPAGKRKTRSVRLKMVPPAVAAHISASKSAAMIGQRVAVFRLTSVGDEEVFLAAGAATVKKVSPMVLKSIQEKRADETGLRNSVYTELLRERITFPKSAISKGLGVTLRRVFYKNEVYKESDLSSLFAEFEKEYWKKEQTVDGMKGLMQGLPVTTTSRPDATVIVKSHHNSKEELIFGEFKNNSSYSVIDSINQFMDATLRS
jgi:hypothetical protein